jgi:hypothetical protein
MNTYRLSWLPPFLVGAATAVVAEVSIGLLLYAGGGLLRAMTLLMATLLGALALGLWSAPRVDADRMVTAVRRRWMLALVAYAAGVAAAGAWSALGGLAANGVSRGVGLALLAGAPLYGSGAVLGAMGTAPSGRPALVGALAAAGAASGVVLTGVVLVPSMVPVSMYVVGLIALAGAAVVHGFVLGLVPERSLVDEEASLFGLVRVDDRAWGRPRRIQRTLSVGGRTLGGTENGRALRAWERTAAEWVRATPGPGPAGRGSVLLMGASAVALQERLRRVAMPLTIVERNPVVWRMAVRHFDVPRMAKNVRVETGDVLDRVLEPGRFSFVVADGGEWGGGAPLPSVTVLGRLRRALRTDGVLLLGGDDPSVLAKAEAAFEVRDLLARSGFPQVKAFAALDQDGPGRLLLAAGSVDVALPNDLPEMSAIPLPGEET